MGGEKTVKIILWHSCSGSPPRRRGKVHSQFLVVGIVRITPAWAGKRWAWDALSTSCWDYPRVGGEKTFASRSIICMKGSPPRRRGIVVHKLNGRIIPGITPAWAGKSMTAPGRSSRTGDHPRVGGEKNNHIIDNQYGKGSPPRRRGKGDFHIVTHTKVGITPAWAGKRAFSFLRMLLFWDHPRVGGEKRLLGA